MFSAALERILNVAAREAMVRRHANLTVEHLLYAAAHDPDGEEILEGSGVDVPRLRQELEEFLEQDLQKMPAGVRRPPPLGPIWQAEQCRAQRRCEGLGFFQPLGSMWQLLQRWAARRL